MNVEHEKWLLPYMVAKGKEEVALDIGANEGQFTGFLSDQYRKVIAIEPHHRAFDVLKENMTNKKNVESINIALMDYNGELKLITYENSLHTSIKERGGDVGTFNIKCVKLDSLKLGKIDFILIDVEGAEVQVLEGASKTLEQKPRLLIEMHLQLDESIGGKVEKILNIYHYRIDTIKHPLHLVDSPLWHQHYWLYGT